MNHSLPFPASASEQPSAAAQHPPVEIRLGGRQASLDGIVSAVHQAARRRAPAIPWQRLELRLSSQQSVAVPEARQRLRELLRELGMPYTLVSVRPIASRLDDAAGEQLLNLFGAPASHAHASVDGPSEPNSSGRSLVSRLLARLGLRSTQPGTRIEPGAGPATPAAAAPAQALPTAEALALLREALGNAAATAKASASGNLPIEHVELIVRLTAAHARLDGLVAQDPQAAASIARQLRAAGLAVAPNMSLDYRHEPPSKSFSTSMAGEVDVELRLHCHRPTPTAQPVPMPPLPRTLVATGKPAASVPAYAPTAMPPRVASPRVQVRIMGTSMETFEPPVTLLIDSFPAQLDRAALEAAGLLQHGAELTHAVSNRAPLGLALQQGRLVLQAPRRAQDGTAPVPLYYRRRPDGGRGEVLPEQTELGPAPLALWLNNPAGVADPANTGRSMPVLWVELRATPPS